MKNTTKRRKEIKIEAALKCYCLNKLKGINTQFVLFIRHRILVFWATVSG